MKKVKVRFPNESDYVEMTIDWNLFEITNEFEKEYFGWYDDTYLAILKEEI